MSMSKFTVAPRIGHLIRFKRIVGYLSGLHEGLGSGQEYQTTKTLPEQKTLIGPGLFMERCEGIQFSMVQGSILVLYSEWEVYVSIMVWDGHYIIYIESD